MAIKRNPRPASTSPLGKGRGEGNRASPLTKGGSRGVRPSALLDTRIVYCGDCLDQLRKLPDACVDLIYIDPPFNSNRNYEVFWGETKEKRAFEVRPLDCLQGIELLFVIAGLDPRDEWYNLCAWTNSPG